MNNKINKQRKLNKKNETLKSWLNEYKESLLRMERGFLLRAEQELDERRKKNDDMMAVDQLKDELNTIRLDLQKLEQTFSKVDKKLQSSYTDWNDLR
jgi:uridine kinase